MVLGDREKEGPPRFLGAACGEWAIGVGSGSFPEQALARRSQRRVGHSRHNGNVGS